MHEGASDLDIKSPISRNSKLFHCLKSFKCTQSHRSKRKNKKKRAPADGYQYVIHLPYQLVFADAKTQVVRDEYRPKLELFDVKPQKYCQLLP